MDYAVEHEGRAYTPDGVKVIGDVEAHNAALEAEELAIWATRPDRWQVYVVGSTAQTWRGKVLGAVVRQSVFRTNLGRMTAVTIMGTNGAIYHGRYGSDWAQLCRVKKSERSAR